MNRLNAAPSARAQLGFSMIECLIVLAVLIVALSAAIPGFAEARQRRQLDGLAAQLETDMALARSQAVAANQGVRISFLGNGTDNCYVIHTGKIPSCSCAATGGTACSDGAVFRFARVDGADGVRMKSNVPHIVFDPIKGTSSPTGTVKLEGREGKAVHLVVNILGRVRSCSPGGAVPGYKACA